MGMREIKFRVWDKRYETMHDYFSSFENFVAFYSEANKPDDFELMQYTGLKDKNGVEIYEGDIVKGYGEVVYGGNDYPSFHFEPCNCDGINELQVAILSGECEVIGNIYENPELLKLWQ